MSGNVKADPTCNQVLEACKTAYDSQKKQIEIRDLQVKQTENYALVQTKRATEAEDKLASIWRNPWVYLGVGLVGGILIMR